MISELKKEWVSPSVTVYGDMTELTQAKSFGSGDFIIFDECEQS